MKYQPAYTLVELLIITTITGLLVTFGASAYSRAQRRQVVKSATDSILTSLERAQKRSLVGDKDCTGELSGYQVSYSAGDSSLTATALCSGGPGSNQVDTLSGATFSNSGSLIFRTLGSGVLLGGASVQNIDFAVSNDSSTYRIEVTQSGTIRYLGAI